MGGTCSLTRPPDITVSIVIRTLPGGPSKERPLKGGGKWLESWEGVVTVPGAEQGGVRGVRTGHLPFGVQPVPGQETPFSFISSLEGLRVPPRV